MADPVIDPRFREAKVLFFGLGAQKSGSTWLHHFLRSHPDACVPAVKELRYWRVFHQDRDEQIRELEEKIASAEKKRGADATRLKMLRQSDASHRSYADVLFRHHSGETVVGEITPAYALLPEATLATLASLNPDTRFVFMMRDPADRLMSATRMRLSLKGKRDRSEPLSGEALVTQLNKYLSNEDHLLVARSKYEMTISALENVVAPEKIGYFFYEDFFGQKNAGPICDFLSIARVPGDFDTVLNQGNEVEADGADAFRTIATQALAPTYDFMAARFGDRLPARWRQRLAA